MQVTIYSRPEGRASSVDIENVRDTEAEFFRDNNIEISMEDLGTGNGIVMYGRYGMPTDERENEALIVATEKETCEDALERLKDEVQKGMADMESEKDI